MSNNFLDRLRQESISFVNLHFSDLFGVEHRFSVPAYEINESFLIDGKVFDGSSILGWKPIHHSDMLLIPDASTAVIDPFCDELSLAVRCNVLEPLTKIPYDRDPRGLAQRAENYLKTTGIADQVNVGAELEFFVFDHIAWTVQPHRASYLIDSQEGAWNTNKSYDQNNSGYRPKLKGGYMNVSPLDSSQNLRSAIAKTLEKLNMIVEVHYHEVATANQNEIVTRYQSLTKKADELQLCKYAIRNIAHAYGKTVTFMPKPIVGDNGSGMHCHQSLSLNNINLFSGNSYAGLSELALYYIGGILKHAPAITAFSNATTNSYRRLIPGFEAPVYRAYASCNRSAAIRIPYAPNNNGRRIEIRFPDSCNSPYLSLTAQLMAGLDGIINQIHPGEALDRDLYELTPEEALKIPALPTSLEASLNALDQDREFLVAGEVFNHELINTYIDLKSRDCKLVQQSIPAIEFDLYYGDA